MGMQVALALAAGLLIGNGPGAPTEPAQKVENATVVIMENATITISPGTKISVRQVKTEHGKRIRLEMPGMAIEAIRLRMKCKGTITEMQVGAGDAFEVRTSQEGTP